MSAQWFNATPLLPQEAMQYWAVHLGWGLVLACALVFAAHRFGKTSRNVVVASTVLALVWCSVPGPTSLSYWLGLAFQAPSLVTDLLCIWYLHHCWRGRPTNSNPTPGLLTLSAAGVLLGWVLLLDTLALLPWPVYAIGFSPVATAVLFFVALLPWMLHGRSALADSRTWIVPLAVCIFIVLRWPSGNVWDAVLDPSLWLLLNGFMIRRFSLAIQRD
ncbi:MAG: hypothetical protein H7Y28_14520 [Rhodoferax sp.]|nr:hypothetical protein [Rhodoferax sp.]